MMNNFAWAAIMLFSISGASQAYFGRFKGCYQRGYYCRERLYSQISLKVWDSEEKLAFSSRLPLRRHIARWGTFSVDPGIVVSLYASAHHPYTTLATGEWMIFWPSEDGGQTECSHHLVFESSLHVRLLPATLQSPVFQHKHKSCRTMQFSHEACKVFSTLRTCTLTRSLHTCSSLFFSRHHSASLQFPQVSSLHHVGIKEVFISSTETTTLYSQLLPSTSTLEKPCEHITETLAESACQ